MKWSDIKMWTKNGKLHITTMECFKVDEDDAPPTKTMNDKNVRQIFQTIENAQIVL